MGSNIIKDKCKKLKFIIFATLGMLVLVGCTKESIPSETTEAEQEMEEIEVVAINEAQVGDVVRMGTYEQDGNEETEDSIYWDVLDKDGDAILLISHDVIAYRRFSDSANCVIWEDSQIRTWLNQEFYEEAFDEAEQKQIKEVELENPSTREFYAHIDAEVEVQIKENKQNTKDRIFLLGWKEAEQYYGNGLTDSSALQCRLSYIARQQYEEMEERILVIERFPYHYKMSNITWMLRSTGGETRRILGIQLNRQSDTWGWNEIWANEYSGIRPVMWIRVND